MRRLLKPARRLQHGAAVLCLCQLLAACGTQPEEPRPSAAQSARATPGTKAPPKKTPDPPVPEAPLPPEPMPKTGKMVMVVIDTLRADRLGCMGFEGPISPTIDVWAGQGVVFEQMHAASPWTAPSFGTLFTGVSPTVHGAGAMLVEGAKGGTSLLGVTVGGLRTALPTLPEMLPDEVVTAAFITNAFVSKSLGFDRGFDHFDHRTASMHRYRTADQVTEKAISWLDENHQKPFFMLLHYFDPHMKYGPPAEYVAMFAPVKPRRISVPFTDHESARDGTLKPDEREKRFIRGLYNGEVRFVDDQLALLDRAMERLGLKDDTWILVVSDHGEEQFEHGSFDHGHAYEEEVVRVPFIVRAPEGRWRAGGRVSAAVSHVDVLPTVLALFGKAPYAHFEGKSLLPLMKGANADQRTTYIEYNLFSGQQCALFDGRYKIVWDIRRKRGFYYDLKTDPKETKRLSSDDSKYKALYRQLQQRRKELASAARGKAENRAVLSGEDVEALRSLGYLD